MQRLLITCVVLVFVAAGGAYAGFKTGTDRVLAVQTASEESNKILTTRIGDLEATLLLLAKDTADLRTGQETYAETQSVEKEALTEALAKLEGSVSAQENELDTLSKASDVSGLIAEWSPFVYDITCKFDGGAKNSESSGSAVLQQTEKGVRFVTSRHILVTEGETLTKCELDRPNSVTEYTIPASRITLSEEHDAAFGFLDETPPGMPMAQVCPGEPEIGEKVVILGYPSIGAQESVTATEGIIAGFDEDYYTTSAKIDKGNSGGAAISITENCFLGLPTLVFAGRVESLARILPATSI